MSFIDPTKVSANADSFDREGFFRKYSKQLLARTPKDMMNPQRHRRLLENVSLLLKWDDFRTVMEGLGGEYSIALLTKDKLLCGAVRLNRKIGMKDPNLMISAWNGFSHRVLFDAFVIVDFYCGLGNDRELSALFSFRALLGTYINLVVRPEEDIAKYYPLTSSEYCYASSPALTPIQNPQEKMADRESTTLIMVAFEDSSDKHRTDYIVLEKELLEYSAFEILHLLIQKYICMHGRPIRKGEK